VLAVWVGNFDGRSNPSFVGRSAAAPLFFEISEGVRELHLLEATTRESKAHFTEVEVCPVSGGHPHAFCPLRVKTNVIPGVSPIQICDVHRAIPVDILSGKRACIETSSTRNEVFEFWPSDVLVLFSKAGLSRKVPPPFLAVCDETNLVSSKAPRILTPQPNITYQLRQGEEADERVPLLAHADGSVSMLTWFAGAELIGRSKPGQIFHWAAPSGRHELRAVDDQGGMTTVVVNVQWRN
jgi:penicillin-binding protein 1C